MNQVFKNVERLGNTSIYKIKNSNKLLIARASRYYERTNQSYWYRLGSNDLERMEKYNVNNFAYLCGNKCIVSIPTTEIKKHIKEENMFRTPPKGDLKHYHIIFSEKNN